MKAKGHVFKYGDNVDTDVIIPANSRSKLCYSRDICQNLL